MVDRSGIPVGSQPWRVAVGGDQVRTMTPEQIAQAYRSGELDSQTPIWPPGYAGWQALGSIQQLRVLAAQGRTAPALSQYDESEDDPTRMWMGPDDYEVSGLEPEAVVPGARPSSSTGPRRAQGPLPNIPYQGPSPQEVHAYNRATAMRSGPPVNVSQAQHGVLSTASSRPSSVPPFRAPQRSRWIMIGAGLLGAVGLASAVYAARGGSSADQRARKVAAVAKAPEPKREAPAVDPVVPAGSQRTVVEEPEALAEPAEPGTEATRQAAEAQPAEAKQAEAKQADAKQADAKQADAKQAEPASAFVANDEDAQPSAKPAPARVASNNAIERSGAERSTPARDAPSRSAPAAKPKARAAAKLAAAAKSKPPAEPAAKPMAMAVPAPAKKEKEKEKEGEAGGGSSTIDHDAAAQALASASGMASSCRPPGGPTGTGKVRVGYNNDGSVGSVEVMTASFAGTTTASCVSMVFRRAKIPAFKGEPPTFVKSFTIPE